jgi:hypothetical protein
VSFQTFGKFRFDLGTGELWLGTRRIKLQPTLARLLTELVAMFQPWTCPPEPIS